MSSAICAKKSFSSFVKTSYRTKYPFLSQAVRSSGVSLNFRSSGVVSVFTNFVPLPVIKHGVFARLNLALFRGVLTGCFLRENGSVCSCRQLWATTDINTLHREIADKDVVLGTALLPRHREVSVFIAIDFRFTDDGVLNRCQRFIPNLMWLCAAGARIAVRRECEGVTHRYIVFSPFFRECNGSRFGRDDFA